MTCTRILKTLLSALGRKPLEAFPQAELRLATETSEMTLPAIVAACSLTEHADAPGNATADADFTFTLSFHAADFSDDEAAALIEATDAALSALTPERLNAHAEEIGAPEHFLRFRWKETAVPAASADETLECAFTFTAAVQR